MKLFQLLILICVCQLVLAQHQLPIIKAKSNVLDIRDDERYFEGVWKLEPQIKPDVYITSGKRVRFYTDLDSISFSIDPGVGTYDFIVLLNEKDSAYIQIQYQISHLEKLRSGKVYNSSDNRYVPKFSYQSATHKELVKIREALNLDSIAGGGNEISRILNLMHWVHNVVPHDGSSLNPASKNTIELIDICKKEKRGLNCRMLATILNECYLSMGFKSRFVTCMPRKLDFDDCHVINMVYSSQLKKWIWLDPTFDAYLMNEKGELLGIDEVRERLIHNGVIILNPEANWNRKFSQNKASYLDDYMAKNLYRFECPIVSEFNSEGEVANKERGYVQLLPLNGLKQSPQREVFKNEKNGSSTVVYKTNNPDVFWSDPKQIK